MFNPKFTQNAFTRIQKQTLEGFKSAKGQPAAIADEVIAKLNYGKDHILAMNEDGTEYTVKNMKIEDIQYYYDNFMTSQKTRVVVVGDIKQEEVLPKLAFLDKLPNKKVEIPAIAAAPPVDQSKIFLVDVPKAAQTEFRVGYNTGLKYDATGEYFKAGLMNYALGGGFNSRLNLNLREDKGWTYGARSGFSSGEQTGDFEFSAGIRADATDSALIEVVKEMKGYASTGISDNEMTFMKSAIGQRDALRYETGAQKAGFIGNILKYNLPADYTDLQSKIVKGITKNEINALSKKWINADKMNMLLVGDKAKVLAGLQKMGYQIIELDSDGNKVEKKAF